MRRLALLVTATAVPMIAACGAPAAVPEWKEGMPAPAAPRASDSVPAPDLLAASTAPSRPGTPSPEPDSEPGDPVSAESFGAAVREHLPELAVDRRPEEITEMGDAACASLASGQRRAAAAADLTGYGLTSSDARELVTLARTFHCRT